MYQITIQTTYKSHIVRIWLRFCALNP